MSFAREKTPTSVSPPNNSIAEDMKIRVYTGAGDDSIHAYKFALINRAMQLTADRYGDYTFTLVKSDMSYKRALQLFAVGDQINMNWAPIQSSIPINNVTALNIDFLRNLLGYRVCLVDQRHYIDRKVKSLQELRRVRIGLGALWPDLIIYKRNQLSVYADSTYSKLFDLLTIGRFDCIPLGINEVGAAYKDKVEQYPHLAIEPSFVFHYDYPMRFFVSNRYPRLIERLNQGFSEMEISGEFDALFTRYHRDALAALKLEERSLICLDEVTRETASKIANPDNRNCQLPKLSESYQ